ncbi:MAG: hypothetical protein H7Y89_16620 [Steroidobacteraceae bacterium]|nr:hypothetical protein [Steroidobacteraceae bacterium]
MTGRRTATMLCVLLAHISVVYYSLVDLWTPFSDPLTEDPSEIMELMILEEDETFEEEPPRIPFQLWESPALPEAPLEELSEDAAPPTAESTGPDFVDWPIEQRISAKRALEAEREAERVAKMFSGPDGTWASLTKRERSRLKKFRWKPGVDGFEYDDKGNAIFHISEGCVVVNLAFIGCALGKAKVHGDLFKDMRLYFDEQRLPQTDDGNGTEPEALRPAN